MSSDRLLTEIERQQKYLAELPANFEFPLFNSSKALESQRQSGYRTTASAAREIVDNSIEAGASKVHIIFDHPTDRKKNQRKDAVSAVAFIDDAAGMLPLMARYALSWGGGTHFDDHEFIGRFGFGLPNASINQTRKVDVYTRTKGAVGFSRVSLDINNFKGFNVQTVPEPEDAKLPDFVQEYLKREGWSLDHGTVVVWDKPDRLSFRTGNALKEHLLDDFGVTYRYLLKEFELKVEGTKVQAVDPLFLDPEARYYLTPVTGSANAGGAQLTVEKHIPVKYVVDPETGGKHLKIVQSAEDLDDKNLVHQGVIHVRVARLPLGFAVSKGKSDIPPLDDSSFDRFEVRKPRRGMSFVRSKREIETVDVFPRRLREETSGMGKWPLLQGYAYHWGVEVRFGPELDDVFGIANDKQTVRPIEDFWRVLAEAEIDKVLNRENRWQNIERHKVEEARKAAKLSEERDTPSPAEMAAQSADVAMGTKPKVPDSKKPKVRDAFERKMDEQAQEQQKPREDVVEAARKQAEIRPYKVVYVDGNDSNAFYEPDFDGTQVVVKINKRHPFFTVLYANLLDKPGLGVAKEAVDLVLIALAKGELGDNEQTTEIYRAQRETQWSPFLATAMRDLERRFASQAVEEEVEGNGEGGAAAA